MATPAAGEHRRALIIGLAGLGLVLVLFVVSRVLSGGDDGTAPVDPAPTGPSAVPGAPEADPTPGFEEGGGGEESIPELPDTFEIAELRDPFDSPLLDEAVDALPPPTTPPTPPGAPGAPGGPGATTTTTAPVTGDGDQRVTDDTPADEVELIDVDVVGGEPVVVVAVDGERFTVGEGERFGPGDEFEVVSIDTGDDCALFRRGDEPFTLCVGEERLVK